MKQLQTQIAQTQSLKADNVTQANDYQSRLRALQELQAQCSEKASELQSLLAAREAELSRTLTALKVAAAQIAALDGRDRARSPSALSQEVCCEVNNSFNCQCSV